MSAGVTVYVCGSVLRVCVRVCVCVCVLSVYVVGEACTLFLRTETPAFSINTHNQLYTSCILHSFTLHASFIHRHSSFITLHSSFIHRHSFHRRYWGDPKTRKTLRKFWNPRNMYEGEKGESKRSGGYK